MSVLSSNTEKSGEGVMREIVATVSEFIWFGGCRKGKEGGETGFVIQSSAAKLIGEKEGMKRMYENGVWA